jgi:hypothetical protein
MRFAALALLLTACLANPNYGGASAPAEDDPPSSAGAETGYDWQSAERARRDADDAARAAQNQQWLDDQNRANAEYQQQQQQQNDAFQAQQAAQQQAAQQQADDANRAYMDMLNQPQVVSPSP